MGLFDNLIVPKVFVPLTKELDEDLTMVDSLSFETKNMERYQHRYIVRPDKKLFKAKILFYNGNIMSYSEDPFEFNGEVEGYIHLNDKSFRFSFTFDESHLTLVEFLY